MHTRNRINRHRLIILPPHISYVPLKEIIINYTINMSQVIVFNLRNVNQTTTTMKCLSIKIKQFVCLCYAKKIFIIIWLTASGTGGPRVGNYCCTESDILYLQVCILSDIDCAAQLHEQIDNRSTVGVMGGMCFRQRETVGLEAVCH